MAVNSPVQLDDMTRGYFAGFNAATSTLPKEHACQSPAFKHGWFNGRDDRLGKPRECASVLRARADLITKNVFPVGRLNGA